MVCVVVQGTCMNLAAVPMQVAVSMSTSFSASSIYRENSLSLFAVKKNFLTKLLSSILEYVIGSLAACINVIQISTEVETSNIETLCIYVILIVVIKTFQ